MILRQLLASIMTLAFALSALAGPLSAAPQPSVASQVAQAEKSFVIVDAENKSALAITQNDVANADNVVKVLNQLPADRPYDLLISTDSPAVLEKSVQWAQAQPEKRQPHFIPYGNLIAKNAKKVGDKIRAVGHFAGEAIHRDPIGMMITVVTTAMDSYVWIHSQSIAIDQRIAMVMLNVILAATFGLDKDLWTRLSRSVQKRMVDVLKRFQLFDEKVYSGVATTVVTSALANISLSVALQLTRMSVLSMDHLMSALGTAHFWGTSVAIGTILSISGIGWSEHLANIDQKKKPASKFIFRRFMEIRTLAFSYMAPSSRIMQPDVYGITPILLVLANGAVGLVTLLIGDRLTNWIEDRATPLMAKKSKDEPMNTYRRRFIDLLLKTSKSVPLRCESVF